MRNVFTSDSLRSEWPTGNNLWSSSLHPWNSMCKTFSLVFFGISQPSRFHANSKTKIFLKSTTMCTVCFHCVSSAHICRVCVCVALYYLSKMNAMFISLRLLDSHSTFSFPNPSWCVCNVFILPFECLCFTEDICCSRNNSRKKFLSFQEEKMLH